MPKRVIRLVEMLTMEEIAQAIDIAKRFPENDERLRELQRVIILPNMERINALTGQENDSGYLTVMVDYALFHLNMVMAAA